MSAFFENEHGADEELAIEIDLDALAERLAVDPGFLRRLVPLVLTELLREARARGNLFGPWAQQIFPPAVTQPNVVRRLN